MTDQIILKARSRNPTIVYLSGPMRGVPNLNYPEFNRMARKLRTAGFAVINPAENLGGAKTFSRQVFMRLDYSHVLQADEVWVLSNWSNSEGARAEVLVAMDCGIPIFHCLNRNRIFPKITTTNCAYD